VGDPIFIVKFIGCAVTAFLLQTKPD